jgi:hypothetical protein
MARIRTIKPEFFTHEALYEAEVESGLPLRVAFAGLFTQADRDGRFKWSPRQLKLGCLPYDDVDFSRVLHALVTRGFVKKYEINSVVYGLIPSFKDHQMFNNKEKASSLPEPVEFIELARDDHASITRESFSQGERKGKERKGKEREQEGKGINCPAAPNNFDELGFDPSVENDFQKETQTTDQPKKPDPVEIVFETWVRIMDRGPRTKLTDDRRKLIKARLKVFSVEDLELAFVGCTKSAHHMGKNLKTNPQGTIYDEIELILRSDADTQRFIGYTRTGANITASRQDVYDEFINSVNPSIPPMKNSSDCLDGEFSRD